MNDLQAPAPRAVVRYLAALDAERAARSAAGVAGRRERAASARLNEANRELERAVRETENAERTLRVYAGERPGGGAPAGAPAALPPAPLRDRNGGVSPLLAGEVLERATGSNWIEDSVGGEECGP